MSLSNINSTDHPLKLHQGWQDLSDKGDVLKSSGSVGISILWIGCIFLSSQHMKTNSENVLCPVAKRHMFLHLEKMAVN